MNSAPASTVAAPAVTAPAALAPAVAAARAEVPAPARADAPAPVESDLQIAGDILAVQHLLQPAREHPVTVADFVGLARSIAEDRASWEHWSGTTPPPAGTTACASSPKLSTPLEQGAPPSVTRSGC